MCDRCSASIADCHRNCGECGSDYCLDCCDEMRLLPHYRVRAGLRPVIKRWDGDAPCFGEVEADAVTSGGGGGGCGGGDVVMGEAGVAGDVRSLPAAVQESRRAVIVKCPHCIEEADKALTVALNNRASVEGAASADAAAMVAAAEEKRRKAMESPLKLKVRCVSVTTKKSLAIAEAMPDPLDDLNGLADRYGGDTAPRLRQAVDDLTFEFHKNAKEATDAFIKEVFDEPGDESDDGRSGGGGEGSTRGGGGGGGEKKEPPREQRASRGATASSNGRDTLGMPSAARAGMMTTCSFNASSVTFDVKLAR